MEIGFLKIQGTQAIPLPHSKWITYKRLLQERCSPLNILNTSIGPENLLSWENKIFLVSEIFCRHANSQSRPEANEAIKYPIEFLNARTWKRMTRASASASHGIHIQEIQEANANTMSLQEMKNARSKKQHGTKDEVECEAKKHCCKDDAFEAVEEATRKWPHSNK